MSVEVEADYTNGFPLIIVGLPDPYDVNLPAVPILHEVPAPTMEIPQ